MQRRGVPAVKRLLVVLLVGCGGEADPCADIPGTCVTLRVTSESVPEISELQLDILYGTRHLTTRTQPDDGGRAALPLATAIGIDDPIAARFGVVAGGSLDGMLLGTGAASTVLDADVRVELDIELTPLLGCTVGTLYCGGNLVSGDAGTLYRCEADGPPSARGYCNGGCITSLSGQDACRGVGGPCVDTGFYCGGDKLDGDPQTLYTCNDGVGTMPRVCPNRCVVAEVGRDDYCE